MEKGQAGLDRDSDFLLGQLIALANKCIFTRFWSWAMPSTGCGLSAQLSPHGEDLLCELLLATRRNESMRKYGRKKFSFIILCRALFLSSHQAKAVDPGTVAAVAVLTGAVVSLFDSGADTPATRVSQSHTMLKTLHERLVNYDAALIKILEKLDNLPKIVRTEIEGAQDRDQARVLLSTMGLIGEDVRVVERGENPIANPQDRLGALQLASRNMMHRSPLNLPYIIAAIRTERAFIKAIGVSDDRKTADWEERRETYHEWFKRLCRGSRDSGNACIWDSRPNLGELNKLTMISLFSEKRLELYWELHNEQNQRKEEFVNVQSLSTREDGMFTNCGGYSSSTNMPARIFAEKLNSSGMRERIQIRTELMSLYAYLHGWVIRLAAFYRPEHMHHLKWPDQWPSLPQNWRPVPSGTLEHSHIYLPDLRRFRVIENFIERFDHLEKQAQEYSARVNWYRYRSTGPGWGSQCM